ncbi:MAG: hypothetical protein ACTSVD_09710 [Candidatus Thorarchaeota archaeon]
MVGQRTRISVIAGSFVVQENATYSRVTQVIGANITIVTLDGFSNTLAIGTRIVLGTKVTIIAGHVVVWMDAKRLAFKRDAKVVCAWVVVLAGIRFTNAVPIDTDVIYGARVQIIAWLVVGFGYTLSTLRLAIVICAGITVVAYHWLARALAVLA